MSETNIWEEIELRVDYDFQPEEAQVLYPNDSAYPGCPASVTVNSITFGNIDIMPYMAQSKIEAIEADILEGVTTQQGE